MENAESSGDKAKLYLVPMNLWSAQSGINLQHTYPELWEQQHCITEQGPAVPGQAAPTEPAQAGAVPWSPAEHSPAGSGAALRAEPPSPGSHWPFSRPHLGTAQPVMQHLPFLPLLLRAQIGMGQINNDNYAHQMLWRRVSESPDMLKDKHVSWSTSWGNIIRTTSTRRELVQHRRANTGPT